MHVARRTSLRRHRLLAELSLTELAQRTGLSRTTIHLLERGHQHPSLVTAQRLARALETTVDVLFPDTDAATATLETT